MGHGIRWPTIMYSIPYSSSEDKIIVYQYDDLVQVMFAEYRKIENKMTTFTMKTGDGKLYYSLQENENLEFGNIVIGKNPSTGLEEPLLPYLEQKCMLLQVYPV